MSAYQKLKERLPARPQTWLVTGSAGFIGSNLVETLLDLGQKVVGLDNYATGSRQNLEQVQAAVGPAKWAGFRQIDGDIEDPGACKLAAAGVDHVLHQAALGSVPRSFEHPDRAHASNATGFLNLLIAARDAGVRRMVYASSSAVYGDQPDLPHVEEKIGSCLSPYAATKLANELYAAVFARCYGLEAVGLRYFNVFGPRQDPEGAYAAVIPKWIAALIKREPIVIYGDGLTSRDFCYVANVVQANLLAATMTMEAGTSEIFNVAVHSRTTLNDLFHILRGHLLPYDPALRDCRPAYQDFRAGDVRHSEADISKISRLAGYQPTHTTAQGLSEALDWYRRTLA